MSLKPPVRIALTISQETFAALHDLDQTGLFGRDAAEVAARFIDDRIQQCVREGWLPMPAAALKRKGGR